MSDAKTVQAELPPIHDREAYASFRNLEHVAATLTSAGADLALASAAFTKVAHGFHNQRVYIEALERRLVELATPWSGTPLAGGDGGTPEEQIARLGAFILDNFPDEPSRPEGAVDCAIRLLAAVVGLTKAARP